MVKSKSKAGDEAKQCDTPEILEAWILKLCEGWNERDADALSVAYAGEMYADDDSVEAGVFRTIRNQLDDTRLHQEIVDGVRKLAEMAKAARHG